MASTKAPPIAVVMPPLPSYIAAGAGRTVKIPKGPLSKRQAKRLMLDMRLSELRNAKGWKNTVVWYGETRAKATGKRRPRK